MLATGDLSGFGELIKSHGSDFVIAIFIIVVGWILSKYLKRLIEQFMLKVKVDKTIAIFISHTLFWLLFSAFLIAALKQLGIHTTSFVAVLGAVGLAIVLSFQKSLSNVATGLMLIMFRPFKVGDYVKVMGCEGHVKEIGLFTTTLIISEDEIVILPNAKISDSKIFHYVNGKQTEK